MRIGVPKETFPGEARVALVPAALVALQKAGAAIAIERGAGEAAGFPDAAFTAAGAEIVSRDDVFSTDILLQVRTPPANPEQGRADLVRIRRDQILIGFGEPLSSPHETRAVAERGAMLFAMELMPRITRAQSMDALSSMATIAGYKAVLIAASALPRMFPMLMTAAGTIAPARVFIMGAGVAGLQAISAARRLGAKVEAYDVRSAVKEQVQSLGAKFVELPLETAGAEDKGGYATAQDEAFYRRQREVMLRVVASNDVVITTALVPGRVAPILVTEEMIKGMQPGSVVVDLAAERGGNCDLTEPDRTVVRYGVTIMGPTNLPATVPYHASQMYAKNITTFLLHVMTAGAKGTAGSGAPLAIDTNDEITRETLVTRGGEIVHPRVKDLTGAAR
jgi:H+-translocating NAD(P) transhydrogenase subunit alpha